MPPTAVITANPEADLLSRMRNRLQSLAYSSQLYRLMISGPVPKALNVTPNDPWPGDAQKGRNIIDGQITAAGQSFSAHPPLWLPEKASLNWLIYAHRLDWLRDLRAVGGDTARRVARSLLASWFDHFENWSVFVWEPALVARRIIHLVALHDFVLASADPAFTQRAYEALVRHHRHLMRIAPGCIAGAGNEEERAEGDEGFANVVLPGAGAVTGVDALQVLTGLAFSGVALPDGSRALQYALETLPQVLARCFAADGCVSSRAPQQQIEGLKCLIDLRQALKAARVALPPELPVAIDRATSALRFFRHGDGALALFNGANEADPLIIDALLTQADVRGRAPKNLTKGGYERLSGGRLLLIADTGAPAPAGFDNCAYAGFGSFELSLGKERLIVNCGSHPGGDAGPWYQALASTAAHSTLTAENTNICEILPAGGEGKRSVFCKHSRSDDKDCQQIELSHDGWKVLLGLIHTRRLALHGESEELKGEDILMGAGGKEYALRFHLHPHVQASIIQNGAAALLRLPSGAGMRLKSESGILALEESLYFGKEEGRKTRQVVLKGVSDAGETRLCWSLVREGKSK
jgi:uncharacterized heparinase superfamily protein